MKLKFTGRRPQNLTPRLWRLTASFFIYDTVSNSLVGLDKHGFWTLGQKETELIFDEECKALAAIRKNNIPGTTNLVLIPFHLIADIHQAA